MKSQNFENKSSTVDELTKVLNSYKVDQSQLLKKSKSSKLKGTWDAFTWMLLQVKWNIDEFFCDIKDTWRKSESK